MNKLSERIRKVAELKEREAFRFARAKNERHRQQAGHKYQLTGSMRLITCESFEDGAKWQHARLKPLLLALAEAVSTAQEVIASERRCFGHLESKNPTSVMIAELSQRLTAIEKALEGSGE